MPGGQPQYFLMHRDGQLGALQVLPDGGCRKECICAVASPPASGSLLITAATVVMMMGRKRSMLAWWMARSGVLPSAIRCSAKSTIMMPFFFTMPISMNMPT